MYQARPAPAFSALLAPPEPRPYAPILAFGILFPLFAILVEGTLHPLRDLLCDPLGTPLHWAACLSVPALLLWGWCRPHARATPFTAAFALTVAAFYCLTLFPVLVLGLIALLVVVGLLPLAPLFALIAAARQLHLCRQFRWRTALAGVASAGLLLAAAEAPAALVRQAIQQNNVRPIHRAIPGFARHLSEACAQQQGQAGRTPLEGWLAHRPSSTEACRLHYRLTGEVVRSTAESWFDSAHGGIATGSPRPTLSLATSSITGDWQPGTPIAQLHWDLEFRNHGPVPEEARFRVALPPQGVVNGAQLWVDGQPRDAVFGGTDTVREAYRKVAIVQRRDPLLVTWAGPAEVFVQCFPVPAAGTMRIRLAIAAPALTSTGEAVFPRMTEHNFSEALPTTWPTLRPASLVPVTVRNPHSPATALADSLDVTLRDSARPRELFVVIDGSAWMARVPGIEEALATWRRNLPVRVWLAGDTPREVPPGEPLRFTGGADNVPALSQALAAAGPGTWVLWIHGGQPFVGSSPITLEALAPRPGRLLGYRVNDGVNEVWNSLARAAPVTLLPHLREALNTRSWKIVSVNRPSALPSTAVEACWASTQPAATAQLARVITRDVGAVVLERAEQYEQNGLPAPPGPAETETPEPATWLTMGTILSVLYWRLRRASTQRASVA